MVQEQRCAQGIRPAEHVGMPQTSIHLLLISCVMSATAPSNFGLLRKLKGIIHLNAEVANCAFQLGVTEQQLHCSQVLRAPIDQRSLGVDTC